MHRPFGGIITSKRNLWWSLCNEIEWHLFQFRTVARTQNNSRDFPFHSMLQMNHFIYYVDMCACLLVTMHWLCIVRVSFVSSLGVYVNVATASKKLIFIKTKSKSLIQPTSLLMATLNVLSHHRSGSTHIPFCFALKLTIIYHLTKCHFFTIYSHDSLRISFNSFASESFAFFLSLPKIVISKFQFHINST